MINVWKLADQIKERDERDSVLKRITKLYAKTGDTGLAENTAQQIESYRSRNRAFLAIIEELADVGKYKQAEDMIEDLSRCHPRDRNKALGYIDEARTNSG